MIKQSHLLFKQTCRSMPGLISLCNKGLQLLVLTAVLSACSKSQEKDLRPGQEMRAVPTPSVQSTTAIKQAWRASIGGSDIQQPIFLQPGFTSNAAFIANSDGDVARINLENGSQQWQAKLDMDLAAAVGVDKAVVAVATTDGEVIALNAADGSELWRQSLGVAISAPPSVGEDRVIIRSLDGQVIALKATTGENVWAYQRPISSLGLAGDAVPLLAGEGMVTGFSNGRIVVSSIFNGQVFWEKQQFRPSGSNLVERLIDIDAEPTLLGQYILVGAYQGGIAALRLRDGQEVWRSATSSRRKISFDKTGVYVTSDDGAIYKLNIDTGKEIWSQAGLRGHGVSNPVVAAGVVYIGDLDGKLYSLDADSGEISGRSAISSGAVTSLHQRGNSIYAYSVASGHLTAFQ